jgi:hypothetical protein
VSVLPEKQWYWCMDHKRVEDGDSPCPPDRRMGPYRSEEEAAHWREKVASRNETWDEEDRRWEGDDE